ncbi:glucose-6-phosphate dehydrogenase protein OpcA [Haloferula helveola]|uniref:Glucose-6-phosphate dehydrogenase protein OpcA n=1 Tax=Haloferula helveola TaxID=490095 RepID=A0ABN6GYK9_9BACT|nr:glucose-6-phosphate dehydrogenase protein OpcA [Haloferula helveola]
MSETLSMHPELGREVPIGSIDRELHQLWEEDDARTNASLINLAVYSEEPDALVRNSAAVRELTREHACRAILIGIDREAEEASIRAWITAHCHLSHGQKSVCCEQIAFALTGRATGRLRNTVFAHLNSDLPLILWWQGELSPIFSERFYSLVDRFVFDSSSWKDPLDSFSRILEASETSNRLVVQDLSWTRCYQFRVSVAALFDDPVASESAGAIQSVRIVHHPDHRLTALQLLAWLAVQAGWRDGLELHLADSRRGGNGESFSFESATGQAITATLVPDADGPPLGRLEIEAGEVRIDVVRDPGSSHLLRRLECGGHRSESPAPVDPDGSVELVGEQLSRGGKNSLYRKILPRFLELLSC